MDKIIIENLTVTYQDGLESLHHISFAIPANAITVLFGPAGGGKSTLLRVLDRLSDLSDVAEVSGRVMFNGQNILDPTTDVVELRRKIGIVFSRPVALPLSIYDNVSFGLQMAGERRKDRLDAAVERALRQAILWDEVYDRLHSRAMPSQAGSSSASAWRARWRWSLR